MKITRLCGLVTLAVIAVLVLSVPAQALDHPWDGTKVTDTTSLSSTTGTGDSDNNGDNDGPGIKPAENMVDRLIGWITNIFSSGKASEKVTKSNNSEAVERRTEGKKLSLKTFCR